MEKKKRGAMRNQHDKVSDDLQVTVAFMEPIERSTEKGKKGISTLLRERERVQSSLTQTHNVMIIKIYR